MSAAAEVLRFVSAIAHPKREIPSSSEKLPRVTMDQYLTMTFPQPYLMDGSLKPEDATRQARRTILVEPEDPAGIIEPQGPDYTL